MKCRNRAVMSTNNVLNCTQSRLRNSACVHQIVKMYIKFKNFLTDSSFTVRMINNKLHTHVDKIFRARDKRSLNIL